MVTQLLDNRYQIVRVLGGGTFGQTFLAQDIKRPGHPECVVKQLRYLSNDPQSLQIASRLFKQEAEILEKLGKHPQIPTLLADIEENQEFYLVQEFIDGHPLTDEIIPGQPWNEDQVIKLLIDVLKILDYVHQERIIHRDIKPDNLMRRDSDNQIVLIDFGAVKELRTQIAQKQINQTVSIGTPGYMPIEQFHGKPQFNSDIYAVGMIAIQALLGIDANELQELRNPNNNQVIWRKQQQLKSKVANVIDKMVSPGYQRRYQSVTDVLADLEKILAISESKASSTNTNKKYKHKKQLNMIFAWVLAVIGITGLAILLYNQLPKIKAGKFYKQGIEKLKKEDKQGAIEEFTEAIKIYPNYSEAFYERAKVHYNLGEYKEVIEDTSEAIRINPGYADAYSDRCGTYFIMKEYQKAIDDCTKVIGLNPKFDLPYLNRGISYSKIEKNQEAIEDLNKFIQSKPNDSIGYLNRGIVKGKLKDFREAIEDYNQALKLSPENPDIYYNRGIAHSDSKEYPKAIEDYSQAIKLKSDYPDAYYNRGDVYRYLNDKQAAIKDFEQAAKLYTAKNLQDKYNNAQEQIRQIQNQLTNNISQQKKVIRALW